MRYQSAFFFKQIPVRFSKCCLQRVIDCLVCVAVCCYRIWQPLPGGRNLYSPEDGDKYTFLCDGELAATHRWESKLKQR